MQPTFFIFAVSQICFAMSALPQEQPGYDVVIYGGTSGGIAAAVQVSRMGGTVIVIEPTNRIGGLTTGGLGQTDIGNKAAIGGISLEFYKRIREHYENPGNWEWQDRASYRSGGQSRSGSAEHAMWTFEPSAALKVMNELVNQADFKVAYGERLDRTAQTPRSKRVRGVIMDGPRIIALKTESGNTYRGSMFVDATYEGDLMAGAGVSYTVGRESNSTYGETLSGVQTRRAIHHQFVDGVDPYVTPGNPSSGLLPSIDPDGPGLEGHGDHRVQAYCFRMCLTDHPDNRIPFTKPSGYDPKDYELLFRNLEAGATITPWSNSAMPNRKTDVNNNRGFSTDFIGQNYDYPEASYDDRVRIVERHLTYQKGLMWSLANHPRVPASIRKEISRWGSCKDEFEREDGWQQQLYIREARRMIGDYVMIQKNCQGIVTSMKPVGMAAYTMDSHQVQRYVDEKGQVKNEGDVQVGGFSPYPIDYGSLTPKKNECTNLLVPVCLSASHMAFGSIRMEPVFMVLGQSAATAAMQSIKGNHAVQELEYTELKKRLIADKQVLVWTGPRRRQAEGLSATSLAGTVVDDYKVTRRGFDSMSSSIGPFVELGYRHDGNAAKGQQSATFEFQLKKPGKYEVRFAWTPHSNRASNVPVTIHHAAGETQVTVNQKLKPKHAPFGSLGTFIFEAGQNRLSVSNAGTDGYVLIDAIQLLPIK